MALPGAIGLVSCCWAAVLPAPLTVQFGAEFSLAPGQSARTAGVRPPPLLVRFVRVVEDGRCPRDINCAVTRPVSLDVEVVASGRTRLERLAIYERTSRQPGVRSCAAFDQSALRLRDVQPWPSARSKVPPSEYRATFVLAESCDDGLKAVGPAGSP